MPVERIVLIVSPTPSLAQAIGAAVRQCGYSVAVVRSFAEAKKGLASSPHLLITELKLGEHNGLHLAVYAGTTDTPAIVISEPNFEHEVEQLGFVWMSPATAKTGELPTVVTRMLQGVGAVDSPFPWHDSDAPGATALSQWHPPGPSILH